MMESHQPSRVWEEHPPRRVQESPKSTTCKLSGWRGLGVLLTISTGVLTIILVSFLLVSVFQYGDSSDPLGRRTIFRGRCQTASRSNLLIHLAINAIASGVLASSNFFMQILVAPSRNEVNKAHAGGKWLEVGMQSWRNVPSLPRIHLAIWLLFALSSIPLHLVFNGSIIQSKSSTDFLLVVAAEPFLQGAPFTLPPIAEAPGAAVKKNLDQTLRNISASVSGSDSSRWERIDLGECTRRYNNIDLIFASYRHVVMVLGYSNGTAALDGWDAMSVVPNIDHNNTNARNHLWWAGPLARSDRLAHDPTASRVDLNMALRANSFIESFNPLSGRITMKRENISLAYIDMQVQYCMSEKFEVPCRLAVENLLLLLVCIMCAFKFILCVIALRILLRRGQHRLMTPGDAIESFILSPDPYTAGMCTLSRNDSLIKSRHTEFLSSTTPRPWISPSRWAGSAIPTSIWVLSYTLIGLSLMLAAAMLGIAARDQGVFESHFGHHSSNVDVKSGPGWGGASLLALTIIANIPQLLLSICYLTYNGLYTRMFAEFEWSFFSIRYQPLRVTEKKGLQRSTYRLQLPYMWSIPLILVSLVLHLLYSNTIYVNVYEGKFSLSAPRSWLTVCGGQVIAGTGHTRHH